MSQAKRDARTATREIREKDVGLGGGGVSRVVDHKVEGATAKSKADNVVGRWSGSRWEASGLGYRASRRDSYEKD